MTTFRHTPSPSHRDDGFTLLAVVGVVFLLSLVVVTLMRSASSLMATARSAEDHAAAEYLADGLTRLVARHLSLTPLTEMKSGNLPVSGLPAYCRAGDTRVTIAVTISHGQIDLNASPEALLFHVLKGSGLPEDKAREIAIDIADYRTPGDASLTGSEKSVRYQAAGRSFGPKSAPFATVQELDQLPSMSRSLYETLRPLFTVQSARYYIDPLRASYPVARALNGLGLAPNAPLMSEDQLLRLRHETVLPLDFKMPAKTRSERERAGTTVLIEVTAETPSGARFKREMISGLEPGSHQPGTVLEWSQGSPAKTAPLGTPVPACIGEVLSTAN